MIAGVEEMRLVDEEAIVDATRTMAASLTLTVEPSAGAAWAAARQQPSAGAIALVLAGGNVFAQGESWRSIERLCALRSGSAFREDGALEDASTEQ